MHSAVIQTNNIDCLDNVPKTPVRFSQSENRDKAIVPYRLLLLRDLQIVAASSCLFVPASG
jgi:hypothetical protein